ncbi:signal peptide peptidase SppA [Polluticoccus soli]|uniref:signal peptide peptidase SppA n=1 Tax=Polluticoccus soli TaxID=3034150 RepID=UPI0023E1B42E|nr:signal peptide peptidase SppA [Flavipsychrobacter sp. JY13-12]
MKQFFKMFFASMLAMIVTGVIMVALVIGLIVGAISKSDSDESRVTVASNSVLLIDVNKAYHEQGEKNSFAAFSDENSYQAGLYDAINAIKHAKTDDRIKGIYIKLTPSGNGWATMQQLRAAIVDFKTSKKFVYAYGENISQGAYYIASAADSVYVNPVGDIELKGMTTTIPFFKGTLDKLEIQPEIFYAGKFKSATEPFRAYEMSPENRHQVSEFQADFWSEFLRAAAEHTKTDTAMINQWAVSGAIQFPQDAERLKLVDGLRYWDQVEKLIRTKAGTEEKEEINYVDIDNYADHVRGKRKIKDERIAVLFAEGNIVDGGETDMRQVASKNMREQIRKIAKNDKVKAVVLRVNSPGGSALASEVILRELELLKQKKPLVVSMGDLAASGGYYISCKADSIFAMSNTITGSIGVFGMMFNVENMLKNKLGVTFDEVKNAPYADFPTATRPLTADEAARMQRSIDNVYTVFKSRVAQGRKMTIADVDSIAQGRVWTGSDALRIGLVDAIGGLDRAIASAAKLAKIDDYQVTTYPEPVDRFEAVMRRFKGSSVSAEVLKAAMEEEMGSDYQYYKQVKALRSMQGKALMAMPYSLTVK